MAINMTPDLIAALVQDDPSLKRLVSDKAVNAARQQILSQLNINNTAMGATPTSEQLVNWGTLNQAAQQLGVAQGQQVPVAPVAAPQAAPAQPNNPLAIVDTIYKEVIGNFDALHRKLGALAEGVEGDFKEMKESLARLASQVPVQAPAPVSAYGTPITQQPAPAASGGSSNAASSSSSNKNKSKED